MGLNNEECNLDGEGLGRHIQIWYFSNENINKSSPLVVLSLTVVVVGVE